MTDLQLLVLYPKRSWSIYQEAANLAGLSVVGVVNLLLTGFVVLRASIAPAPLDDSVTSMAGAAVLWVLLLVTLVNLSEIQTQRMRRDGIPVPPPGPLDVRDLLEFQHQGAPE